MPKTVDPLAAALDEAKPEKVGTKLAIERHFGDRPEVLESIRKAYHRGLSYKAISIKLSEAMPDGETISDGAVRNWLVGQKITTREIDNG